MKLGQKLLCITGLLLTLAGCAKAQPNAVDPNERFNRHMYGINDGLDRMTLRPLAKIYSLYVPPPLQAGITNFFNNILLINTFPNDILQGKLRYAATDVWRFVLNTAFGFGGLFNVGARAGLPDHYEDFGLTFAYWGDEKSPYFVLPILGPSTFRDAIGRAADYAANPWWYVKPTWVAYTAVGVYWVSVRARYLPASKLIAQSFDPYVFVRDAYLQHRNQLIAENKLGDYDPNRVKASVILEAGSETVDDAQQTATTENDVIPAAEPVKTSKK
jgi:phospholipid-binding lipoprotein MlaA